MKRFLLVLLIFMALPVFADTMPFYINSIPKQTLGVYQTDAEITLFSHPDANSNIIKKMSFSYQPETMPDNVFGVLINDKKLGFLYVSDIDDDGWVQVIYDKRTGAKGWVQTIDRMQFLPWLNFYNMYGRKYGLRLLKDTPEDIEVLKSKSEDNSQIVSKLRYIKQIKLTVLRGNWALVSVQDLDKTPKTGFLRWRSDDGIIYAFPNIK
ncbi:MAG: hypothetical protein E7Z89_02365 [Cyanobacteria bacterium SIG28]|nr:hypothetical protein [Cyanobacteria bacterium SIG28]